MDLGIAICHFVMGLEAKEKQAEVFVNAPGPDVPAGAEYIASVRITG